MNTRRLPLLAGVLLPLLFPVSGAPLPPQGDWKCTVLEPRTLALTGDYIRVQRALFQQKIAARGRFSRLIPRWAAESNFHLAGAEAIAQYRPAVAAMLQEDPHITVTSSAGPLKISRRGMWLSPVGQACFPDRDGRERFSRNADVAFYCFLELARPLVPGEKVTVTMPAGEKIAFVHREETPTPLFKINQVGYMPGARKYAYLGAWLGTAGPLRLHQRLDGKPFRLVDAASGRAVFTGTVKKRFADPVNDRGTPFTGEEVLELDFSSFDKPGKYYLAVEGIGRSWEFRIGDDTMAEAFYIHARGLYHQRCGIARKKPYTNWTAPACHLHCLRGTFPPDDRHYARGSEKRAWGFFTTDGKGVQVDHFQLIKQNAPIFSKRLAGGGWHDAADFDRRPYHLGIVGDLAAVYLMKPENFSDGQLDLPESGNGIPDILDEALWGMEHLRRNQQFDGGVGTWVETVRHPTPADGMACNDRLPYYLSCATRNSTLEYAAYASELALALRRAGATAKAEGYRQSAAKAWQFAFSKKRPPVRMFRFDHRTVFYREEPVLAPELVVKAGLNLHLLGKEPAYLQAAEAAAKNAEKVMQKNGWRWSPFFWAQLEFGSYESQVLEKLRQSRRKTLLRQAGIMCQQQEKNYPVRVPWHGPRDPWVHTMSWGTYHPLRRARLLVMAHAMTGDRAFLDAAMLANDFHNGANPSGSSMTSGLGRVYPVRFLDLNSYADGIAEFVPGITPYRNTYGLPRAAVKLAYGLFYPSQLRHNFAGLDISLVPEKGLPEKSCAQEVGRLLPIWRRWCNVEGQTVAASEFTVWETIGPAAAVTGYLLNKAQKPRPEWNRKPVEDIRTLPGYNPLP